MLERVQSESFRLGCPSFADELVGGEAIKGLQSPGEVVGGEEVGEMANELIVRFVVISFDGRVLDCPVHPLDLSVIRYVIPWRLAVRLFSKGDGVMVSPSGTRGAGSTKVRAGRR